MFIIGKISVFSSSTVWISQVRLHPSVTFDDVELDGGGGSVVRPTLVLPTVGGGDGLQEERDHGDV